MNLDYSTGAKPLWSQVANVLREKIKNEEYEVGDILPTEMQLIKDFGVSRITMRKALDYLVNEGYIIRQRGKGTLVKKKDDVSTSMKSSFGEVKEKGERSKKKLLEVKMINPTKEVAELFNIERSSFVIIMKRAILVENKTVAIFDNYINPIVPITVQDDFNNSFYKLLSEKGYAVTTGKEQISATISNGEDKKIFDLKNPVAIITRKKIGYSKNIPVELTYSRYVADGYTITVELK